MLACEDLATLSLSARGLWKVAYDITAATGSIPEEAEKFRRLARADRDEFQGAWSEIRPLLRVLDNGRLALPVALRAREEAQSFCEKQSSRRRSKSTDSPGSIRGESTESPGSIRGESTESPGSIRGESTESPGSIRGESTALQHSKQAKQADKADKTDQSEQAGWPMELVDALRPHAEAIGQVDGLSDPSLLASLLSAVGGRANAREAASLISKISYRRFGPNAAKKRPYPETLRYWPKVLSGEMHPDGT